MAVGFSDVLLGISDGPCPKLNLSPYDNKIGGLPDFFPGLALDNPPSCTSCHNNMLLVLQAYCPLEGSQYHRLLHIFACSSPFCSNSKNCWLALRSQQKEVKPHPPSTHSLFDVQDWCDDANDWDNSSDQVDAVSVATPTVAMVMVALDKLNVDLDVGPYTNYTNYYPCYYLNVISENEISTDDEELVRAKELMADQDIAIGKCSQIFMEPYENSEYEKFLKFKEKLKNCPEQLIRYERNGRPLLIHKDKPTSPLYCNYCHSPCTFELQLMPQLIYLLTGFHPLPEFGTVLIYTCENSCFNDQEDAQFYKETCIVQNE